MILFRSEIVKIALFSKNEVTKIPLLPHSKSMGGDLLCPEGMVGHIGGHKALGRRPAAPPGPGR